MFEQKLEDIKGTMCIDQVYKNILDSNGFMNDFKVGWNTFSYAEAVSLVNRMYHMYPSVPKYLKKRFNGVINQIIFSFGPEFEERHKQRIS